MSDDFHCVIKRTGGSSDAEIAALIRASRPCRICQRPPSREPHTCPYLMDVHEGEPGCDRLCNCCDECTRECAEDV